MVDQLASTETCRLCGVLLNQDQVQAGKLCAQCAEAYPFEASGAPQTAQGPSAPIDFAAYVKRDASPDPDNPPWGPITGISVLLSSFALIVVVPMIAVVAWILIQTARGAPLPDFGNVEEFKQWVLSPNIILLQVVSTIAAHAITLAICWAVVTKLRGRPFWLSLGWSWGGRSVWYWLVFSACILVALQLVGQILSRFLPEAESPMAQWLKASPQIRIAVAVLATFTAPLVEEVVYRGLLFSSLRKHLGMITTVLVVTLVFGGVHVFQNWGAWVSVVSLMLLSLALTIVRARTKSILPCVFIHTVNNAVASVLILLNKGS